MRYGQRKNVTLILEVVMLLKWILISHIVPMTYIISISQRITSVPYYGLPINADNKWLVLLGNTCNCDVTVRVASLNSNCTLNQNRPQNIHHHSWERKINQNVLITWYFENTNYLQWLNGTVGFKLNSRTFQINQSSYKFSYSIKDYLRRHRLKKNYHI